MNPISDNNKFAFGDIRREVAARDNAFGRFTVAAARLRFNAGDLVAGGRQFRIDEARLADLCGSVAAPAGYLKRLGEPLRSQLLSKHFADGDHLATLNKQRLLGRTRRHLGEVAIVSRDKEFIGFARPDLQTLNAADILHEIERVVGEELNEMADELIVANFRLSDDSFELNLVTPKASHEVAVNDVLQGGLHVRHSFLGTQATQIETYLHRLVCSNGAVRRECITGASGRSMAARIRRCTTNNLDAVDQTLVTVREHCRTVVRGLREKLASVSQLREQRLQGERDVRRFIEAQLGLVPRLRSQRLIDELTQTWRREGAEESAYGVWNAMTRAATHLPDKRLRPTIRRALSLLSGVLATRSQHVCPRCFRMISLN